MNRNFNSTNKRLRLKTRALALDVDILDCGAAGDCMYKSISQIIEGSTLNYQYYRDLAATALESSDVFQTRNGPVDWQNYLDAERDGDKASYIAGVRKKRWGDNFTLVALSIALNVNFFVISDRFITNSKGKALKEVDIKHSDYITLVSPPTVADRTYCLVHELETHYMAGITRNEEVLKAISNLIIEETMIESVVDNSYSLQDHINELAKQEEETGKVLWGDASEEDEYHWDNEYDFDLPEKELPEFTSEPEIDIGKVFSTKPNDKEEVLNEELQKIIDGEVPTIGQMIETSATIKEDSGIVVYDVNDPNLNEELVDSSSDTYIEDELKVNLEMQIDEIYYSVITSSNYLEARELLTEYSTQLFLKRSKRFNVLFGKTSNAYLSTKLEEKETVLEGELHKYFKKRSTYKTPDYKIPQFMLAGTQRKEFVEFKTVLVNDNEKVDPKRVASLYQKNYMYYAGKADLVVLVLSTDFATKLKCSSEEIDRYKTLRKMVSVYTRRNRPEKIIKNQKRKVPDIDEQIKAFPAIANTKALDINPNYKEDEYYYQTILDGCIKTEEMLNQNFLRTNEMAEHISFNEKCGIDVLNPFDKDHNFEKFGKSCRSPLLIKFPIHKGMITHQSTDISEIIPLLGSSATDSILAEFSRVTTDFPESCAKINEIHKTIGLIMTEASDEFTKDAAVKWGIRYRTRETLIDDLKKAQSNLIKEMGMSPLVTISKSGLYKYKGEKKRLFKLGIEKKIIESDDGLDYGTNWKEVDEEFDFRHVLSGFDQLEGWPEKMYSEAYKGNQSLSAELSRLHIDSMNLVNDVRRSPTAWYLSQFGRIARAYIMSMPRTSLKRDNTNQFAVLTVKGLHGWIVASITPNEITSGAFVNYVLVDPDFEVPDYMGKYKELGFVRGLKLIRSKPYRMNQKSLESYHDMEGAYYGTQILALETEMNLLNDGLFNSFFWDYTRQLSFVLELQYLIIKNFFGLGNFGKRDLASKFEGFRTNDIRVATVMQRLRLHLDESMLEAKQRVENGDSGFLFRDPIYRVQLQGPQSLLLFSYMKQILIKDDGFDDAKYAFKFWMDEVKYQDIWTKSKFYNVPFDSKMDGAEFLDRLYTTDEEGNVTWDKISFWPELVNWITEKFHDEQKEEKGNMEGSAFKNQGAVSTSKASKVMVPNDEKSRPSNYTEYQERESASLDGMAGVRKVKKPSEMTEKEKKREKSRKLNQEMKGYVGLHSSDLSDALYFDSLMYIIEEDQIRKEAADMEKYYNTVKGTTKPTVINPNGRTEIDLIDEQLKDMLINGLGDKKGLGKSSYRRLLFDHGTDEPTIIDLVLYRSNYYPESVITIGHVKIQTGYGKRWFFIPTINGRDQNKVFDESIRYLLSNHRFDLILVPGDEKLISFERMARSKNIIGQICMTLSSDMSKYGDMFPLQMIEGLVAALKNKRYYTEAQTQLLTYILRSLKQRLVLMPPASAKYIKKNRTVTTENNMSKFERHLHQVRTQYHHMMDNNTLSAGFEKAVVLVKAKDENPAIKKTVGFILGVLNMVGTCSSVEILLVIDLVLKFVGLEDVFEGGAMSDDSVLFTNIKMITEDAFDEIRMPALIEKLKDGYKIQGNSKTGFRLKKGDNIVSGMVVTNNDIGKLMLCITMLAPRTLGQRGNLVKIIIGPYPEINQTVVINQKVVIPLIRYTAAITKDLPGHSYHEDNQMSMGRIYQTLLYGGGCILSYSLMMVMSRLLLEKFGIPVNSHVIRNDLPTQVGGIPTVHPAFVTEHGFAANFLRLVHNAHHDERDKRRLLFLINTGEIYMQSSDVNFHKRETIETSDLGESDLPQVSGAPETLRDFKILFTRNAMTQLTFFYSYNCWLASIRKQLRSEGESNSNIDKLFEKAPSIVVKELNNRWAEYNLAGSANFVMKGVRNLNKFLTDSYREALLRVHPGIKILNQLAYYTRKYQNPFSQKMRLELGDDMVEVREIWIHIENLVESDIEPPEISYKMFKVATNFYGTLLSQLSSMKFYTGTTKVRPQGGDELTNFVRHIDNRGLSGFGFNIRQILSICIQTMREGPRKLELKDTVVIRENPEYMYSSTFLNSLRVIKNFLLEMKFTHSDIIKHAELLVRMFDLRDFKSIMKSETQQSKKIAHYMNFFYGYKRFRTSKIEMSSTIEATDIKEMRLESSKISRMVYLFLCSLIPPLDQTIKYTEEELLQSNLTKSEVAINIHDTMQQVFEEKGFKGKYKEIIVYRKSTTYRFDSPITFLQKQNMMSNSNFGASTDDFDTAILLDTLHYYCGNIQSFLFLTNKHKMEFLLEIGRSHLLVELESIPKEEIHDRVNNDKVYMLPGSKILRIQTDVKDPQDFVLYLRFLLYFIKPQNRGDLTKIELPMLSMDNPYSPQDGDFSFFKTIQRAPGGNGNVNIKINNNLEAYIKGENWVYAKPSLFGKGFKNIDTSFVYPNNLAREYHLIPWNMIRGSTGWSLYVGEKSLIKDDTDDNRTVDVLKYYGPMNFSKDILTIPFDDQVIDIKKYNPILGQAINFLQSRCCIKGTFSNAAGNLTGSLFNMLAIESLTGIPYYVIEEFLISGLEESENIEVADEFGNVDYVQRNVDRVSTDSLEAIFNVPKGESYKIMQQFFIKMYISHRDGYFTDSLDLAPRDVTLQWFEHYKLEFDYIDNDFVPPPFRFMKNQNSYMWSHHHLDAIAQGKYGSPIMSEFCSIIPKYRKSLRAQQTSKGSKIMVEYRTYPMIGNGIIDRYLKNNLILNMRNFETNVFSENLIKLIQISIEYT